MIAYKWVIEQNKKYYPLENFYIDGYIENACLAPYELNKTYNDPINLAPARKIKPNYRDIPGYHFWNTPTNSTLERWNNYLVRRQQPIINAILKCEIPDNKIIATHEQYQGEGTRIIARAFKVIDIININSNHIIRKQYNKAVPKGTAIGLSL
jgi:hypothetical protein